jgi:hypothetical protein
VIIPAVFVLVLLVLVFVLFPAPLAEQVGEHQAPQPPAPQQAARHQKAHDPAFLATTVFILFTSALLTPFAE